MNTTFRTTTIGIMLAVSFVMPLGVFAQVDPNQAIYNTATNDNTTTTINAQNQNQTINNGASNTNSGAYNQGINDNSATNSNAQNQNQGIYDGTASYNSGAYNQGALDNSYVKFNANSWNSSLPSSSAYNQWITTQSESSNTNAKTQAASQNSTINNDIFNPNKTNTDTNTGLFNAGKDASQKTVNDTKNNCTASIQKIGDILNFATCVMNRFLLSIAISLGLVYFVWGVVQYVLSADSAEERKKSKQVMLWGILSLFVIVSVWGLVGFMRTVLGI